MLMKQSTARNRVVLMVDSADHVTGKTGLTLTIKASKDGATFATITPTVTELEAGFYNLALTTTHTNTLGDFALHVTSTGADPSDLVDQIVSDLFGTAQTGDAYARLGAPAGASHAADTAAVKTDTAAIKAKTDSLTFTVAGMVDSNVVDWKGATAPAMTGDAYARLGAPAGASVSADVAAVKVDTAAVKVKTDFLPSAVAGAAGGVFIAGTNAATSITTALTANITGSLSGSVGSVTGNVGGNVVGSVASVVATVSANLTQILGTALTETAGQIAAGFKKFFNIATPAATMDHLVLVDTVTTATTATNLTNAPTAGDLTATMKASVTTAATAATPTAAAVTADVGITQAGADKVWGTTTRLLTAGTNIVLAKGTGVTGFNDLSAAAVNAEADTALSDVGLTTTITGRIDAAISSRLATGGYTTPPTVGAIADQVWDEAISGHAGAGSTGAALSAAGAAGDPWSIALPGSYGAGTAGKIVGDNLDAAISTRATATALATVAGYVDTEVAAIKAKTDNLPSDPADASDIAASFTTVNGTLSTIAGYVDTEIGSIATDLAAVKAYADRTVVRGTVSGTSPTTTTFTSSALSPAGVAADQFKGRIIVFDNATTTTALRGQATDITASSAAGNPLFTFTALTTAPQSGDTFSIL